MRRTSIIGAVLAGFAPGAVAQATIVSPSGIRSPHVAVNASGATVVAWERRTKRGFAIEARTGSSPSTLGPVRRIAAPGHAPRVAIGADGTRAIEWVELGGRGPRAVRVALARPGHGFGKGQLLERRRANMHTVDVAVQPTGRVVAIYQRTSKLLGYALAPRGHAFGKHRDLTPIGPITTGTIALDPRDGAVALAYGTPLPIDPPANQQAAVRTLTTTATAFGPPLVLSDPAGPAEAHPVAVSGAGGTAVAYDQSANTRSLRLARRNADGTWSAPELIADTTYGVDTFAVNLRATLAADGSALAAWSIDYEPSGRGSVRAQTVASVAAPFAAFGPPAPLSPQNARFGGPAVASAGTEAFVATARAHGPVVLATRPAGASSPAPARVLTWAGDGDIQLAAGGSHVLAAWQQDDRLRLRTVR